ncbi:hypothetical protein GCM10009574_079240 [Streptomyces asiaticus]|uniref:Uncharacterized protein n=2 Tax=Streptomyces rhizosphaericus TaxID=114699 RepID=A0ABN1S5Y9_9ACTN
MRERARVGIIVVAAIDPAAQQLLIAVHPPSVPATTDITAGLSRTDVSVLDTDPDLSVGRDSGGAGVGGRRGDIAYGLRVEGGP